MSHPVGRTPWASSPPRWPRQWTVRLQGQSMGLAQANADGALDWPATLRRKGPQPLQSQHLRRRLRVQTPADLHVIVIDCSGSMGWAGRLARAKSYAARLVEWARAAGHQVGILALGGHGVDWLQCPAFARRAFIERLRPVGYGGGTPMDAALAHADAALRAHAGRYPGGARYLWLLTDGRLPHTPKRPQNAKRLFIVDFDDARVTVGRARSWAQAWGADWLSGSDGSAGLASPFLCWVSRG
jgi:magnesium chelatase subunit ChlD-like protein